MPIDPVTIGLISGGAQLASQGINALSQGSMNRKTRLWNEKMYAMQRQHSLQDWTMQNEYNSPQAQMQRLKAAGLNPNMVYDKGATTLSGSVRSAEVPNWSPQATQVNFGGAVSQGLSAYYDLQMKQAQIDNLKTQNTAIANEAILKAAQTENITQGTQMSKFDLGLKSDLRQVSLQAATENLRKLTTDIDVTLRQDERAAASTAMNLTQAVENILSVREQRAKTIVEKEQIREQIQNLRKDGELKQLDINLKRIGVQPGDNILLRAAGQALQKYANPIKEWYKQNYTPSGWKKK
jgi:hypothetical protein